jgi:peptidoglycan/xylan/chitin deacetylase (PgdA/CDA1 family)
MFDVTLTFDNGPDPEATPYVLDLLKERGIPSTFFVVGSQFDLPGAADLCARAHREGHWIGNHTFSHSVPLGESSDPVLPQAEIGRLHDIIAPYVAGRPKLFRPHGRMGAIGPHLLSTHARDYLVENAYTCVIWNSLPRDWENRDNWDAIALNQCLSQDWSVVVVHDHRLGAVTRLPHFIDLIQQHGGRFRQDFPGSCTPIIEGRPGAGLEQIVGSAL